MSKVAFVVLSHNDPTQLLRLTTTLTRLYENPQIVCHHNFTLCPLDQKRVSKHLSVCATPH